MKFNMQRYEDLYMDYCPTVKFDCFVGMGTFGYESSAFFGEC